MSNLIDINSLLVLIIGPIPCTGITLNIYTY